MSYKYLPWIDRRDGVIEGTKVSVIRCLHKSMVAFTCVTL